MKQVVQKESVRAILRYLGAKWRIADFILRHMPRHHSYLEPFFGSGAVLFRKVPAPIETINDINGDVVNLYQVVQQKAKTLAEVVAGIPWFGKAMVREPMGKIAVGKRIRQAVQLLMLYGIGIACQNGLSQLKKD